MDKLEGLSPTAKAAYAIAQRDGYVHPRTYVLDGQKVFVKEQTLKNLGWRGLLRPYPVLLFSPPFIGDAWFTPEGWKLRHTLNPVSCTLDGETGPKEKAK